MREPNVHIQHNQERGTKPAKIFSGAAAGIWTRVWGLGSLRRDQSLVSVLDQVAHRVVVVLDHGLVEVLVLAHS